MSNEKTTNSKNMVAGHSASDVSMNPSMADVRAQWGELFKKGKQGVMSVLGWAYTNSPYVQNQRVKKVSSQPFSADRSNVEKALNGLEFSEKILRETSHSLFVNYPLMKLNNLYADILSYRHYFYPKYVSKEEISSEKYKKERKKLSKWLDLLEVKRTFQNIVLKTQVEGKTAYYMRDSYNENSKDFDYSYLQEIPSDYFKIVGWNSTSKFTISFDFTYFWQAGTSPEQFPPIFKRYYEEMNGVISSGEHNRRDINPNNMKLSPDVEFYWADNKWFYWHTLPFDECFVFSQDESQAYQLPNTAGLFLQAKDLQDYAYLQQELLQLPLSGVVTGTLPMTKNMDGTTSSDGYAVGTEAFTFFTEMFNEVAPKGIQLFLNPATNHQFFKFDGDIINNSNVLTNALQQFNSTAGVGGLNSTTDKPNIMQVKTQQVLEYAYVAKMYAQFENCINVWWKNKLNLEYDWRFKIKGSVFGDESDFLKTEKGLSLGQNYLLPEYLSFFDLSIDDISSIQDEVVDSGIYDKFQVLKSAFTQSNKGGGDDGSDSKVVSKSGRPSSDISAIESDGTASSIANGTNTGEGRVTMGLKHCVECGGSLGENPKFGCFCSNECSIENSERVGGDL